MGNPESGGSERPQTLLNATLDQIVGMLPVDISLRILESFKDKSRRLPSIEEDFWSPWINLSLMAQRGLKNIKNSGRMGTPEGSLAIMVFTRSFDYSLEEIKPLGVMKAVENTFKVISPAGKIENKSQLRKFKKDLNITKKFINGIKEKRHLNYSPF